jgi:hypothetical protein
MLEEMDLDKGGRPSQNQLHDQTSLSGLGIDKTQSHHWQLMASVSKSGFVQLFRSTLVVQVQRREVHRFINQWPNSILNGLQ